MFCAPRIDFDGAEGVVFRSDVLRARTLFPRYRGSRIPFSSFAGPDSFSTVPRALVSIFMFRAPELGFEGTEGVMSRFHVLRARTRFTRY
jgi:hypothetical protein